MRTNREVVAKFTDKYGDEKTIHHTKHGLRVRYDKLTTVLALAPTLGQLIGGEIRKRRLALGWTLEDLCKRSGLATQTPKSRMWEIENGTRGQGIRIATLYAISQALGCSAADLLPPNALAFEIAGVKSKTVTVLEALP